jgi:hypothetical protein
MSLLGLVVLMAGCAPPQPTGAVVRVDDHTIEFPARVSAEGFGEGEMRGYHLIVWDRGGAADHTLFTAAVSDVQVLDALEELGAAPGNALTIDSWDQREDVNASAPDQVVAGPGVEITFVLADGTVLTVEDILRDADGRGVEMRFGGHRANIPAWHSGCIACLYSCPGSKVGNATYTVREFVAGLAHFEVNEGILPADGTEVTVRFRLTEEDAS